VCLGLSVTTERDPVAELVEHHIVECTKIVIRHETAMYLSAIRTFEINSQ
jgi:hypothetical protein